MERVHVQRRALLVGAALSSLGIEARAHTSPTTPPFVIARSKNANVVHYEAHVAAKGALDRDQPLLAYWLMRAEDGRREGLTCIEQRLAYGWSASFDARGELLIRLRAFSQREIRVFRPEKGSFRALARIAGHRALLERIGFSCFPSSAQEHRAAFATRESDPPASPVCRTGLRRKCPVDQFFQD